jgi:hypothetical protein
MKRTLLTLGAILALLLPKAGSGQTNTVPWYAVDMGFAVSSSSTNVVKSVVGQGFVGSVQGVNTLIEAGFLADALVRKVATSVLDRGGVAPKDYALSQNYPNPFNPSTNIKFELPKSSDVKLSVYDVLGREVSVLVNERRNAGVHEVKFDAAGLSSGVYFYRMQAGSFVVTKKLLLIR